MSKTLVALSNDYVFEMVKEIEKNYVYNIDISYKEGVIEFLANNKIDKIITKDSLEGNMTKEIYIKQIKLASPDIKVILFVEELTEIYKNFLLSNGIYNILESEVVDKDMLQNMVSGEDNIIYLNSNEKSSNRFKIHEREEEHKFQKDLNMRVITKKSICVFGTNGSGKSYVASILGNVLSKKLKLNTLIVDLNLQNPSIDIYNNLELNNVLEDIIKNIETDEKNLVTMPCINNKNNKLWYITNNGNNKLQDNMSYKHYEKIKSMSCNKYDAVIYDNSSSMFFDSVHFSIMNSDIIFFVINPNYISVRQAEKELNILVNLWKVDRTSIKIVVNSSTRNSLSNEQIESFLSGYKVLMNIPYSSSVENIINGLENMSNMFFKEEKNIYKLFGIEKNNTNIKNAIRSIGVKI